MTAPDAAALPVTDLEGWLSHARLRSTASARGSEPDLLGAIQGALGLEFRSLAGIFSLPPSSRRRGSLSAFSGRWREFHHARGAA
jgi:hypothetical protein